MVTRLAFSVEAFAKQLGRRRLPARRDIVPRWKFSLEEGPAVDVAERRVGAADLTEELAVRRFHPGAVVTPAGDVLHPLMPADRVAVLGA